MISPVSLSCALPLEDMMVTIFRRVVMRLVLTQALQEDQMVTAISSKQETSTVLPLALTGRPMLTLVIIIA